MTDPRDRVFAGRFTLRDRGLREHTARGTLINAAFLIAVNTIAVLRGFIVVAFIAPSDYGIFGILTISMGVLLWLKQVGISDRYVQQDEPDQERAFHNAFSIELTLGMIVGLLIAVSLPLLALLFGETRLVAPGFVLLLAVPALSLQAPLWVFYRRMEFVRQRVLQSLDPIVTSVVAVVLAAAGAGYWALVIGTVAGAWAAAIAAMLASPFRLAWRLETSAVRDYASFSWPLLLVSGAGMLVAFGTVVVGDATLGLAGVGAITLASTVTQYSDRVDQIVTQTMYPAICAVKDRTDLLFESFVKSNRLALIWGVPFGVGLALFAEDLVDFALGRRWEIAVGLLQAFGLLAAINHVAFNWGAFYRARGDTRPAAVMAAIVAAGFFAFIVPGMVLWGLEGLAAGMTALIAASLAGRMYYVARLFPAFRFARYTLRALTPTLPAAGAVLLARVAESGPRTEAMAIGEFLLFGAVCAGATLAIERALLREVLGYLRTRPAPA